MRTLSMLSSVYHEIEYTLGRLKPEKGGILGGRENIITDYCLDNQGKASDSYYMPDVNSLNGVLEGWNKSNVDFCGIIHSHPGDCTKLSYGDKLYAQKFMESNAMDSMLLFIVMSAYDSAEFSISGYEVLRESVLISMEKVKVAIIS